MSDRFIIHSLNPSEKSAIEISIQHKALCALLASTRRVPDFYLSTSEDRVKFLASYPPSLYVFLYDVYVYDSVAKQYKAYVRNKTDNELFADVVEGLCD